MEPSSLVRVMRLYRMRILTDGGQFAEDTNPLSIRDRCQRPDCVEPSDASDPANLSRPGLTPYTAV
jgi:hypothetical protein